MKLKSIFKLKNYINKLKSAKKKLNVNRLISEEFIPVDLDKIWKTEINNNFRQRRVIVFYKIVSFSIEKKKNVFRSNSNKIYIFIT